MLAATKLFDADPPLQLGEGPIYRFSDDTLHYNDFLAKRVHVAPIRRDTGELDTDRAAVTHSTADHVSCQVFREGAPGYVCLYWQGIGLLDEATGELQPLKVLNEDRSARRMNDGAVDPQGRLWAGEMDIATAAEGINYTRAPTGRLWRYDADGTARVVLAGGLAISNGIGFSPDHTRMYLNDSLGQRTYVLDYDDAAGTVANQRILRDFRGTQVEPDGLVVDTDGNIWTALYNGGAVLCLSPEGEELQRVALPARCVTCPTWGGAQNDTLYVTTARSDVPGDGGGHIYKIRTPARGMPKYKFKG